MFGLDPAEGSNILTIMAGHFLAALERVAGPLTEVSARLPRTHDRALVDGTGQAAPNATPSHVLLHGLLAGGATASVRTVPAGVRSGPPANIAALYQEVAQAIAEDRQPHPGFETALRHSRPVDACGYP